MKQDPMTVNPKTKAEAARVWDALARKIGWHVARADTTGNSALAERYRKRCNQLKREWGL